MRSALCFVLLLALQEGGPPREIPLTLRVNRTIALGVDYLKQQQRPDGSFPGHEADHPGGATALVAFTLLKSGVRRNDEALARALRALAGNVYRSTYSASVHLLLCEALRDPARAEEAGASLRFLLEHQEQGVWSYPGRHACNSNTQFALLGLRSARRMGLDVPEEAFVAAAEGLRVFQHRKGGFLYEIGDGTPYAGMTAAALASWAVLEEVGRDSARVRSALGRHADVAKEAERWLERHLDLARNRYEDGSWTPFWHHSYLWAIERWCGLTARERFAGQDWYAEGATWLVETQARDGSWPTDDKPLENTCFALLFLRRATVSPDGELAEIYAEIDRLRAERPEVHLRPGPTAVRVADWWLAGPWLESGSEVLLEEPPFEPSSLKPRAGARVGRREWERVTLRAGDWTNLDELPELAGRSGDRQLWLLATRLAWRPPAGGPASAEVTLWLDLEDGWDVWLDGQRLSRERRRGSAINGDVRFDLALASGEHLLAVLVEDVAGAAAFGARLTDRANGAPPAGLVAGAEIEEDRRR